MRQEGCSEEEAGDGQKGEKRDEGSRGKDRGVGTKNGKGVRKGAEAEWGVSCVVVAA